MREGGRGDEGSVLDAHAVMHFVALLESAEDGDSVFDAGLLDHHGLEAAFEGGVLLDVLPIFIERGCADGAQFAAGELRLEHVRCVGGAFGRAGADDGVEFVDEEDDLAFRGCHFLEKCLEPIFELAAELRTGDHRADIHGNDAFVLERFRHVSRDDAPREPLHDGRLADARFADKDRIILCAARKDLHRAPDLVVAADHRIDLALAGKLSEIASIFLESLVFAFGILIGHALVSANALKGLHELVAGDARVFQQSCRGCAGIQQSQEEMFGAEIFVLKLRHFAFGSV